MSKLYHYTRLSTVIEHILPSMTLRTNSLSRMNGPKENQLWSFGGVNVPYETLYPDIALIEDPNKQHFESMYRLGEEIKSRIQALCFVYSDEYQGFENEMMWAQYSENHKGVCLEIDSDLFEQENENAEIFKFQEINYQPKANEWIYWNLRNSKDENILQHIERDYESLFLSKSHYWQKEYEKRLLVISNDYCQLSIKNSLSGIYYGLFTDENYTAAINQFIDPEKVSTYRVYFENNRLKRMKRRDY